MCKSITLSYLRRLALLLGCLLVPCSAWCQIGPSLSTSLRATSRPNLSGTFSVARTVTYAIPLTVRSSVSIGAEYVRLASAPDDVVKHADVRQAWKFKGVPLTIGYTYTLTNPDNRLVPVVGAGISYYFSRTKQADPEACEAVMAQHADGEPLMVSQGTFEKHLGMGYGIHAMLGLRYDLSRHLFILAQGRAQYVDGLAFTSSDPPEVTSRFAKLDFAIGLGIKL